MIWFGFALKYYTLNCLEDISESFKIMLDFRNYYNFVLEFF